MDIINIIYIFYPTIENKYNCIFTDPQCAIDVLNDYNDINKKLYNYLIVPTYTNIPISLFTFASRDVIISEIEALIVEIKKINIENKNDYIKYIWKILLYLNQTDIYESFYKGIYLLSINLYTEIKLVRNKDQNINNLYNIIKNYYNNIIILYNNFLNDLLVILKPDYKKIIIKDVSNIYDNIDIKIKICKILFDQYDQFRRLTNHYDSFNYKQYIQDLITIRNNGLSSESLSNQYINEELQFLNKPDLKCERFVEENYCNHDWSLVVIIINNILYNVIKTISSLIVEQKLENTEKLMNLVSKNTLLIRDINKIYLNEIFTILMI